MTPFSISHRELRKQLDPSPTPYYEPVTPTVHLGYRKGTGISRWVLRTRVGKRYKTRTFREFIPDDKVEADGKRVLNYNQIQQRIVNMTIQPSNPTAARICSFCKKTDQQVEALVSGPDCFICDACIDMSHSIIVEHRRNPNRDWSNWSPSDIR